MINNIELKDIRRDTMSGMSWVRLTHEPTGVSAECKETPSQIKNEAIAWAQLEMAYVKEECKRVDEKTRKEAFEQGRPIYILKDGTQVYAYPDGRVLAVK